MIKKNTYTIQKRSLAEEVAVQLQQQIGLGHYKVNEQLPIEAELMKRFGVGRSSIREAIRILVNSGLLRVQQGVGTFVEDTSGIKETLTQRLKRSDAKDLDEVRQLMEMKIAEKAALNRTEKDIKRMKTYLLQRGEAAKNDLLEACIEADIQFHISIAQASKNDILADLYKTLAIHLKKWFNKIHQDTSDFKNTQHLHEQLVKSIEAGDPKKAWNNVAKIIGHVSR